MNHQCEDSDLTTLIEFLNCPLGSTDEIFRRFETIQGAVLLGNELECSLYVRGQRPNKILLVAHADTCWDSRYVSDKGNGTIEGHEIVELDGVIRSATRDFGIGADDRAGCAILWLLKDMGHSLLITDGEEHGQKGSKWLMANHPEIAEEINSQHQFVVQFDRRNTHDFKCYTVGTEEFRAYVQRETGYQEPDRKARTDIVHLCRRIAGVNLSIGYFNEHGPNEELHLKDWDHTLDLCRHWLGGDVLPRFELTPRQH